MVKLLADWLRGEEKNKDVNRGGTRTKIRPGQQKELVSEESQDPEGAATPGPRGGAPCLPLSLGVLFIVSSQKLVKLKSQLKTEQARKREESR